MFPLRIRKIGGYTFLQPTFYGTKHTGTDYEASYVPYYAPYSGVLTTGWGPEGGNFLSLQRDGINHKLIARHLSKHIVISGHVTKGQLIAVTGNTGKYTTNPHCHQEVYISGKLSDPEKYNWEEGNMQLVNDKGTVYIVTGNQAKRKIGIADLESLGLFGDEPQVPMDTTTIPEYQTIVKGQIINK